MKILSALLLLSIASSAHSAEEVSLSQGSICICASSIRHNDANLMHISHASCCLRSPIFEAFPIPSTSKSSRPSPSTKITIQQLAVSNQETNYVLWILFKRVMAPRTPSRMIVMMEKASVAKLNIPMILIYSTMLILIILGHVID